MNKLISFSFASLAILVLNIASSQPVFASFSRHESELISELKISLICNNENLSWEEMLKKLDDKADTSISYERLEKIANVAMESTQIPEENKAAFCQG